MEGAKNMALQQRKTAAAPPLTAEDVRRIVGQIGEDRIASILATGATPAEVVEAVTWLSSDEYLAGGLERSLNGVVAEVYEILRPVELDEEDRPRSA
jgi:hypothetical protein